jgi:hypothetical protein
LFSIFREQPGTRIAPHLPMSHLTAGWVAPDAEFEYDVMQTELGWMLVLRDGPVTLTQVFDSAPAAEAEAQAIALLLTPVSSRPH